MRERFATFVEQASPRDPRAGRRRACAPPATSSSRASSSAPGERLRARAGALRASAAGDLLAALAPHAQWTSSATHAILPLLATDAGVRAAGADRRRRPPPALRGRSGWRGGFWLPECALRAVARARRSRTPACAPTCVELTARFGLGAREHLRAAARATRASCSCRSTARRCRSCGATTAIRRPAPTATTTTTPSITTTRGATTVAPTTTTRRWRSRARARRGLRGAHARAPARGERRSAAARGGGLVVCALDTELLGHWWYEGIAWLAAVVEECARQGLELRAPRRRARAARAGAAAADGDAG